MMLKKDLALGLGVSAAMVTKLSKRGMPTDSVEHAQQWREKNLEPSRLKSNKGGDAMPARPSLVGDPVEVRNPVMPSAQASQGDGDEFGGMLDGDLLYQKTRETRARADRLELDLAEQKKTLTSTALTRQANITAWRFLRDMLQSFGRQVTPKIAHLTDQHEIQLIIDADMRSLIKTFSDRTMPELLLAVGKGLPLAPGLLDDPEGQPDMATTTTTTGPHAAG